MTDGVLEEAGYDLAHEQPAPVVIFDVPSPEGVQGDFNLKIYSIDDNVAGFNTSGSTQEKDRHRNRRRWIIITDCGIDFGAAFDNKGVIYPDGTHERTGYEENFLTPVREIRYKTSTLTRADTWGLNYGKKVARNLIHEVCRRDSRWRRLKHNN
ncbi:MAG: hypothetical protein U5L95_00015 [Candidatus Saccharibacteria bacterium]|nr:hypothetical protein [Candidatus Saccharibacteria bacterium]